MIGISKLYCGAVEPSDALRYGRHSSNLPSHLLQFSKDKRPVVVWNMTRACNLKCVHCYAHATEGSTSDEMSTEEGRRMIARGDPHRGPYTQEKYERYVKDRALPSFLSTVT